ncbi:exoribonuclease II [Salmonella enterica subsp. enterica serovar Heidelberg str. RI-11-014316]|nr:exoribonuclease II [Salmonella enterica subsp. enterica serovar Heidelberg str. RI-11-014316]
MGKVQGKNDRLSIVPDHPLLKDAIPCRAARGVQHEFKEGDWAVAEMRRHPLKGDRSFYADLTQYITFADDHFVPWWVTLARHNLGKRSAERRSDGDAGRRAGASGSDRAEFRHYR